MEFLANGKVELRTKARRKGVVSKEGAALKAGETHRSSGKLTVIKTSSGICRGRKALPDSVLQQFA
jgi:hypothetical protein